MKTVVFEEGGATGGKGDATIVCDTAGRPLRVDTTKQEQIIVRPNGIHGVFPVYGFDLVVTATWNSGEAYPYSWTATQVCGGIVANGDGGTLESALESSDPHLRPAVKAALEKATCENCVHIHYVYESGGGGASNG